MFNPLQRSETHTFIFSPFPNTSKMMKSIQTKVPPLNGKEKRREIWGRRARKLSLTCLQRDGTQRKGGDPPDCSGARFLRKKGH